MGAYPTSPRAAFLEWCQEHAPIFTANAEDIGLTEVQATAFAAANTAAHNLVTAQGVAQTAAKLATDNAGDGVATLRSAAGDAMRSIRAFAELQIKPLNVYTLAQVSPPAPPTPFPPPGEPTNITVTLAPSSGELTLRWKCSNPPGANGTSYIVRRKVAGESQFTFIGVTGKKEFVDNTLIAGPDRVEYTIQAQRSDSTGPLSAVVVVNFGQAPVGGFSATAAGHRLESGATPSTVDGRMVQKMTPTGNGRHASSRM